MLMERQRNKEGHMQQEHLLKERETEQLFMSNDQKGN